MKVDAKADNIMRFVVIRLYEYKWSGYSNSIHGSYKGLYHKYKFGSNR